jgi:hypothetical protein
MNGILNEVMNKVLKEAYIPKELREIIKISVDKKGIAKIKFIKKSKTKQKSKKDLFII